MIAVNLIVIELSLIYLMKYKSKAFSMSKEFFVSFQIIFRLVSHIFFADSVYM